MKWSFIIVKLFSVGASLYSQLIKVGDHSVSVFRIHILRYSFLTYFVVVLVGFFWC